MDELAAPLARQRNIHRAQPALGGFDIESDGVAFIEPGDLRRQIGAVDEHVAAAFLNQKAVALGLIKELYGSLGRCHVVTCSHVMCGMNARSRGEARYKSGARSTAGRVLFDVF